MNVGAFQWLQLGVQVLAVAAAAALAVRIWLTSVAALHNTYRPVLRPAPVSSTTLSWIFDLNAILLQNIGRGPAVAITLIEVRRGSQPTVLAELDLVEPLGSRHGWPDGEHDRAGRCTRALEPNHTYRLLYQDIARQWHETWFRAGDEDRRAFTVKYLGPKRWWHRGRAIPADVKARGQVVATIEPA